ncbi:MAG TPA: SRPBCC domain-containing protein [Chryseosolibacter sp.]
MMQQIVNTIVIQSTPSIAWHYLTDPGLMKQWMAEPEMELEIATDWKVGHPIVTSGFHHVKFEHKGKVLEFERDRVLKYDYLSTVSRLADKPENHTIVEFRLTPLESETSLTLMLSNFPTEAIFKHVGFYWKTTLQILKRTIEGRCLTTVRSDDRRGIFTHGPSGTSGQPGEFS